MFKTDGAKKQLESKLRQNTIAKQKVIDNKSKMEKQVDDIIRAGKPWTDPDFGPNFKSLNDPLIDEAKPEFKNFEWKRASEIYPSPILFCENIDTNDVN